MPKAIFIVGLNGSGKSTIRDVVSMPDNILIIDPDKIQRENSLNELSAGRLASKTFHDAIHEKKDFLMESTLTGKTSLKKIQQSKDAGFDVDCYYVGLSNVDENIKRVKQRVANGGHNIPENIIRRRYDDSYNNLESLVKIVDSLRVYDNTDSFKLRAKFIKSNLEYIDIKDNKNIEGGRLNEFLTKHNYNSHIQNPDDSFVNKVLEPYKNDNLTRSDNPTAVIYDALNQEGLKSAEQAITTKLNGNVRVVDRNELVKLHPDYDSFKENPDELKKQKNDFGQQAQDILIEDAINKRLNLAIEQGFENPETPTEMIKDLNQAAYSVIGYVNGNKPQSLATQIKTSETVNRMANGAEHIYEEKLTDQFIVEHDKQHLFDSNDPPRHGNAVSIAINAAHKGISIQDELKECFGVEVNKAREKISQEQVQKQSQGYDKQKLGL